MDKRKVKRNLEGQCVRYLKDISVPSNGAGKHEALCHSPEQQDTCQTRKGQVGRHEDTRKRFFWPEDAPGSPYEQGLRDLCPSLLPLW